MGGRRSLLACAAVLTLMAGVLLVQAGTKAPTTDELVIIPGGLSHWHGDFSVQNDHPPLAKLWAGLPLLAIADYRAPDPAGDRPNDAARTFDASAPFWQRNSDDVKRVTFAARFMMVLLTVALGVLVFLVGRRLFGDTAGLLAVALFALEPTVLAHGRIVHTDVPSALALLGTVLALTAYARNPSPGRAALAGVVIGAAIVTKFSLVVLAPVLLVTIVAAGVLATRRGERPARSIATELAVAAVAVVLVINLAYAFEHEPLAPADRARIEAQSPNEANTVIDGIDALDVVLPTWFLYGAYNVWHHNEEGHSNSVLGRGNDEGYWWYFPVAFALKTSVPFLLLALAALGWAAWRLATRRDRRMLWLLVPLGLYLVAAMSSSINIGIRHLLPAFPFLFLLAGGLLAALLADRRRAVRGVAVAAVAWCALVAVVAFPNYTPYINEMACCEPGHEYLSDSNVEWGDAVDDLADYLRERGQSEVSGIMAAGYLTLDVYGVRLRNLLSEPAGETRYVAIGASFLNGSVIPPGPPGSGRTTDRERREFLAAWRELEPERVFGDELYLFRTDR